MTEPLDESLLVDIEALAVELAAGAGSILTSRFGKTLQIEYKDEAERDPVTEVDKEAQRFISEGILDRFPDHGIVGEEDSGENDSDPAPDFVWVLDPLDGTKNFIAGLPIFASSIGVLHRGRSIAGAIFIPWPGESGGVVVHGRLGGGAFSGEERLSVFDAPESKGNQLITLSGSFNGAFRFGKLMRGKIGEPRVTGSIAFEMAMAAKGVLQYSTTTGPHLWDVAAGAVIITEAGGAVMAIGRGHSRWRPIISFEPSWQVGKTTYGELRKWSEPLLFGGAEIAKFVTSNMRRRTRALRRRRRRFGLR